MPTRGAELITTPFGYASTAAEVVAGIDLSGRRAVVTDGASGIGVETARALATAGAAVTLAVRDTATGERVAAGIRSAPGSRAVSVAPLELTDLGSVRAFAAAWDGPLDILVNNAGIMAVPELTRTDHGHGIQFATNHLGHFALALGLRDALAAAGSARIIAVSSSRHLDSPVIFDDLHYAFRAYDPFGAYGQSKTANILFAVEATRRWARDGITANALMPGGIATNLQRHLEPGVMERARRAGSAIKTVEQRAATSVLLATSTLLNGVGGRYFEDCNQAPTISRRGEARPGGVAPYALGTANAERLWELSLRLVA